MIISFSMIWVQGCDLSDKGFRFHGQYEAVQSGYRVQVLSQGYVEPGHDLANSAFAIVHFCPIRSADGGVLRINVTARPDEWITLDCEAFEVMSRDFNGRTSEELLTELLSGSGYRNLVPDEIGATAIVIMNSLSGPKGVILEGQIESLRVLQTGSTYGYAVEKDQAPRTWIDSSEVPTCDHF